MKSSVHSKKAHRQEKIAKGIIWFFVILTLALLGWIIVYVLFRGFVSRNHVYYPVADLCEISAAPPREDGDELAFVINDSVRLDDDLTADQLFEFYTKRRDPNWGDTTGQNLDLALFAQTPEGPIGSSGEDLILAGRDEYSRNVRFVADDAEMIREVARRPGALGFVSAASLASLPDSVEHIPLRRVQAPIHPSVLTIENNRQIHEIEHKELLNLFSGEYDNWNQLGGPNLPVHPVLVRGGGAGHGKIAGRLLPDDLNSQAIHFVSSQDELYNYIDSTEGAVGLGFWGDRPAGVSSFLNFDRYEVRQNLDWHFLVEAPARSGKWGGISTIIINTLVLIIFTLLFSTPVGVLGAIYLVEYAKQGRLVRILRLGTETLAGIPSIVFGLFGFIFFVDMLNLGIGFISATLTVTMMILPTIIRTSEEALKSVPSSYREGSLALGASKLQTIVKVVLPAAAPGILTGIILAVGRTVGETAVLIYTLGSNYELVRGPSSSARVLSLHLYNLFSEAISFDRSFATAAVLICIILLVNYSTSALIGRLYKKAGQ